MTFQGDTHLDVGPSLITRRQDIRITLLLDGSPSLSIKNSVAGVTIEKLEDVERKESRLQGLFDDLVVGIGNGVPAPLGVGFSPTLARVLARAAIGLVSGPR
jgi:hypothetical protein